LVDEFTETITLVDFNLSFMKNKRKKSKTKSSLVEPRHKKEIKDKNDDLKKLKTVENRHGKSSLVATKNPTQNQFRIKSTL